MNGADAAHYVISLDASNWGRRLYYLGVVWMVAPVSGNVIPRAHARRDAGTEIAKMFVAAYDGRDDATGGFGHSVEGKLCLSR
jgi:hypothetical protein